MVAVRLSPLQRLLWRGELPLAITFWRYLITYGFALNLGATILALAIILAKGPIYIAALFHFMPLPYVVLAAVGTWRSANRFSGNPQLATVARLFTVFWTALILFL